MTTKSLISIVIPALNAAAVIQESVASAMQQTYANTEIIVVDNGSSDETRAIVHGLSQADGRVRLIESGRTGVSHARNVGIEEARGDYIAFCDADDKLERKALSFLLENIQAADIVAGGMSFDVVDSRRSVISSSARQVASPFCVSKGELGESFEDLWSKNYLQSCCSKLFSTAFLRKNCVRFDEGLSSYEDLSFILDCLASDARFAAIPSICYHYIRTNDETNSTKYKFDMTVQMQCVAERIVSFYETVLKKPDDIACIEHVVQLLVVAINNAQKAPGGHRAAIDAVADTFERRVFADSISKAIAYPNTYSMLLCHLGIRHQYWAVVLLATIRNWIRSVRIAQ